MEYNIKKEPLNACETVFDGLVEQPVDLDFSLPDYCPDIQKILKCQICPQISSRNISGDKLYVEGNATISLMYLDAEKMSIRCCEHNSPFSTSINLKSAVQDAIVSTKTKTEYVNCRAVTPRRLDIHGAFSICAKVRCKKEKDVVCDIDGDGIEKKKISTKCNNVIGLGQQYFNIAEVIDKGSRQPNIEHILKTSVSIEMHDYKTLQNKIMLNASANIKVVYISDIEYSTVDVLEHTVPISQILDIEGVQDNCACDLNLEVLNHEIAIRPSENDESNLLSFECKLGASVVAFEEKDTSILSDVYSVDFESEPKYEKVLLTNLVDKLNETYNLKSTVDLNDGELSDLIDAGGELTSVKCFVKDGKIIFEGKINVCVLAKDADEIPTYFERLVEFTYEYAHENVDGAVFCEENITLRSCECRLVGKNSIEVSAELQLNALVYAECSHMSITDIFVDEEKPREKDKKTALTLYYADDGEELWDIARKYCTCVDKIKLENELEDDTLQGRKMLFIPM